MKGDKTEMAFIDAQWAAIPDYIGENNSVIAVVDVSGSMTSPVGGGVTCMDVAVSLGMYTADRLKGPFSNAFITFSEHPKLQVLTGKSITDKYKQLSNADWGMSTNLQAAIALLLKQATMSKCDPDDMPKTMLIISDMEFDSAVSNTTNLDALKQQYKDAGYTMPNVVFWNIQSRHGQSPARFNNKGIALVSGFSPAILKGVLSGDLITPQKIMLQTVMTDRYDFAKVKP
jgi:hypothetical protein